MEDQPDQRGCAKQVLSLMLFAVGGVAVWIGLVGSLTALALAWHLGLDARELIRQWVAAGMPFK
jgi:hypothetical protein